MFSAFYSKWKINRTNDTEAPVYYSQIAIFWFSIAFSLLAGAIMMAINLKRIHKNKACWLVLLFGVAYTTITVYGLSFVSRSTFLTLIVNSAGAYIINEYFWNKYIDTAVKYQPRSITVPLIICFAITLPIIFLIIYSGAV